jgi:hypothetical protein
MIYYALYAALLLRQASHRFTKSVYTTSLKVLWLSVKPWCDCFLYIPTRSEALTFVCLFHWPRHMVITGGEIWTVGGDVEELPLKLLQLLLTGSCKFGSGIVVEDNGDTHYHARSLSFLCASQALSGFHWHSALTMMLLGNQSISRGHEQCWHWHHLTSAGWGIWWMLPLLICAFSLWIIVQTPGLILFDNTIQKHISPFSYCSRCSKQMSMWICSSFEHLGTHNAETYTKMCMVM